MREEEISNLLIREAVMLTVKKERMLLGQLRKYI
jgi:hypothetical protein